MAVNNDEAWNFCYVLPSLKPSTCIDDTEIVVPNSLQMGWCESPPLFCTGSETARDVIATLNKNVNVLPKHKFEEQMTTNSTILKSQTISDMPNTTLMEVFVDDFIGLTNDSTSSNLQHLSRVMLHGIHSIFPLPSETKHNGGNPISEKS